MEDKLDEMVEFISECADLVQDENGELWSAMVDFYPYVNDVSDNLHKAFRNEIINTYTWIKENTKIVETEETKTVKDVYLEYL